MLVPLVPLRQGHEPASLQQDQGSDQLGYAHLLQQVLLGHAFVDDVVLRETLAGLKMPMCDHYLKAVAAPSLGKKPDAEYPAPRDSGRKLSITAR